MVVMDEVHKQMNDIAAKQKEKIDELNAEIRKLKAMIVKHESRIRTLETKNRELEQTQQFNNNGGAHSEDMDPDEVWWYIFVFFTIIDIKNCCWELFVYVYYTEFLPLSKYASFQKVNKYLNILL